jgi:hypothetical protein
MNRENPVDWQPGKALLRLRLGEFIIHQWQFPALICHEWFFDMPPTLASCPPEKQMRQNGLSAAMVQSCPLPTEMPLLSRTGNYYRYLKAQYQHYYIRIQGTFEEYLRSFNPRTRPKILRRVRKFERVFNSPTLFREFRTPEELKEFWPLALQVSRATFQTRFLGQGLPKEKTFHRQAELSAHENAVRGYLLMAGSRPVSYVFGSVRKRRVFIYDYIGYDPYFAKFSPGTVLQYYILRRFFQEGTFEICDFSIGEGEHKRIFATHHVHCGDIYFLEKNALHHSMLMADYTLQRLSKTAVSFLTKLGVKSKLKKQIRSRFG